MTLPNTKILLIVLGGLVAMLIISVAWRGMTALTVVFEMRESGFLPTEPVEMEYAWAINALTTIPVVSIPAVVGLMVFQSVARRRWRWAAGVLSAIGTLIVMMVAVLVMMGYLALMIERSMWQ